MKITCVCGMGMGSSLIAMMNIQSILDKEGIEAEVNNTDVGSVDPHGADWFVTTRELVDNMPPETKDKTIVLSDFISLDSIREELLKYVK
ncbi:PTS sugar transporter subunit IIB [uncultured Parolsenella sp.]|uniref:PTS sugar transporter subunit IIB n=1 Tax=uncultured Parolsenella sp. TaxID=2083008 RepID=UPI0027D971C5|nr:PTS sugar transporter subunit IIB [uncultured Parolsenella sp.]